MMTITKFYFDQAKYPLGDSVGNEVFMIIDYKNARFDLVTTNMVDVKQMLDLNKQASRLARDLITRKHNVNFSAKIKE